jgi:hypothetical protein
VSDLKTSEVLDAAAAYMEEHGWTQGAYFRQPPSVNHKMFTIYENELWVDFVARAKEHGCRVCSLGAIEIAGGGDPKVVRRATKYLLRVTEADFIPIWNDARNRTQDEAVAALKVAASAARKDEK